MKVSRLVIASLTGTLTGILGGLVGLGGAEFRLPVLLHAFDLQTISAVVINLAVSLVTVLSSIVFRAGTVSFSTVLDQTPTIFNLLVGTIAGSYWGVSFATGLEENTLKKIIAVLLIGIGFLLIGHDVILGYSTSLITNPLLRFGLGILLGIGIGIVSSLLGVAGGELIIPTLILFFSIDTKLAGSLSLIISAPTIFIGLVRYNRQGATTGLKSQLAMIILMACGSILGSFIGSLLLNQVSDQVLRILFALILFISAARMLAQRRPNDS